MIEKDPATFSMLTYLWVFGLAIWGGCVGFYGKVKNGVVRCWNFTEFFGELATSSLSGVLTFYLCEYAGTPPLIQAIFIAISGHMGSRVIFLLEKKAEKKFNNLID